MFDPAIATQTYGMRAVSMRKGHSLAQTAREVHVKIIGLRAHACQDEHAHPDGEKKSAFPNLNAHCKKSGNVLVQVHKDVLEVAAVHTKRRNAVQKLFRVRVRRFSALLAVALERLSPS